MRVLFLNVLIYVQKSKVPNCGKEVVCGKSFHRHPEDLWIVLHWPSYYALLEYTLSESSILITLLYIVKDLRVTAKKSEKRKHNMCILKGFIIYLHLSNTRNTKAFECYIIQRSKVSETQISFILLKNIRFSDYSLTLQKEKSTFSKSIKQVMATKSENFERGRFYAQYIN